MFWQVFLQNHLPTCVLAFKFEIYPVFSLSVALPLLVCLYSNASFRIGLPAYWIRRRIRFIRSISAPHPNNQLSYLDTVSLEHTDSGFVCAWAECTVPKERLMSSLSKCTEVIGQDIRKPANPIQACLLTHTFVFPSCKANSSTWTSARVVRVGHCIARSKLAFHKRGFGNYATWCLWMSSAE